MNVLFSPSPFLKQWLEDGSALFECVVERKGCESSKCISVVECQVPGTASSLQAWGEVLKSSSFEIFEIFFWALSKRLSPEGNI